MDAIIKAVKIAGMQAAVPPRRHSYVETPDIFTQEEADKIFASTGIHSRRILDEHLCASDMCLFAAQTLIKRLNWDPKSIDVLVFVSQDPDYALPATACLMQAQLGLANTAACLDIGLGCSGFVYAYWVASQMLSSSNGKRALILCGDTSTRHLMPDDKGTLPLFGDAGVATALEYDANWPDSYAVFGTDGTGGQHIAVKAGGRRVPTIPTLKPRSEEEEKQLFKEARLHINGPAVFSFTLNVVPPMINQVLNLAQVKLDDIDMFVMHQANKFILEHLRKKAGIAAEKYLIDMQDFGNTSSASVPLAICHQLPDFFGDKRKKILLSGFGVGWSWGSIITDVGAISPELVEMPKETQPLLLEQ